MKNNIIQSEIDVKGSKINVVRVDDYEYISLTDLAKTQNDEAPADVVKNWLRNKKTISFLGVFTNNLGAYLCYKAARFKVTNIIKDAFLFHNEKWDCAEMVLDEQL